MEQHLEHIQMALGAMAAAGPRNLRAYLEQPGPDVDKASSSDVDSMVNQILAADPNHPARLLFSNLLRTWDNVKDARWTRGVDRNTAGRRKLIHELLHSGSLEDRIDMLLPFFRLEEPLIIAEQHQDWYDPQSGVRDYYWTTYKRYLLERRGWDDDAVLNLDNSTRAIVECLSNPEGTAAYGSRGLVMGYVQSGKTANFTGVVARAADAGYRLVIVLAGTWNILRNQTQRRFDKELLGKELLKNDETYAQPPADWNEFLEHGGDPVTWGHYTWQRLTRPDIDFRRLRAAIDNLEFERLNKAAPLFDPSNLHGLPVKLLVVKKHSGILANFVKDLKLIQTRLTDLPTLIIDDESDQAGINTIDPSRASRTGGEERSKTNLRIVELLRLFPRGQYVGYTATPYANALVDPDDPEDLFPKDFIVSLDRPSGYMGVSDFFDPLVAFEDLKEGDWTQPEIAFIRRVKAAVDEDDEDLKTALRSYVLAGALKLYRQSMDPQRYKAIHFRHHTMLVHTSQSRGAHASLADRLRELWDQAALKSPKGLQSLRALWTDDYAHVCGAQGDERVPASFDELIPYLSEAIKKVEHGPRIFLVVNSDDTSEAPDFSEAPVWKVIIGGNKLSRGYTVEGLTVSYYRRVAGTGDTLMQMGRWFGFRPGYRDLVRVFLGVKEGKKEETDLVSLFKEVCRMEERFREDIKRYMRAPGAKRITPKDVPPLISVTGSLPPTARNKMFRATMASKNFGGRWSMLTLTPAKKQTIDSNVRAISTLLGAADSLGSQLLGGTSNKSKSIEAHAKLFEVGNRDLIAFLKEFRWLETEYVYPARPTDTALQIEFLQNQKHGIKSWLVFAPQRKVSFGDPLSLGAVGDFAVKERQRIEGRGFQVFGEPGHRMTAAFLAAVSSDDPKKEQLTTANAATSALRNEHRGVMLFYPVRQQKLDPASIGFELLFPQNSLAFDINFTVRRTGESATLLMDDADADN
jgi:hypothetical protein